MRAVRVIHQVRDAETYKIIAYELEDDYSKFRVTPKQMYSYVQDNIVLNAHLFKQGIMYFTLTPVLASSFVEYHYSDNLKKKLEEAYGHWYEEHFRRMALNMPDDFIYKYKKEDGVYKLYNTYINSKTVKSLEVPSFIADIQGDASYNYNLSYYANEQEMSDMLSNMVTSVFIDKYTNGIYGAMLYNLHDKISLNGLMSFLYDCTSPVSFSFWLRGDIDLSKMVTKVDLLGKLRYVGKRVFDCAGCNLDMNCGKHLRVLEMSRNMKSVKCYDTTLILNNSQGVNPVILKDTQKRNKDMLLDYKDYVKEMIDEYSSIVYDILDDEIVMRFSSETCMKDFMKGLGKEFRYYNNIKCSLEFLLNEQGVSYGNSDSLYWRLKSEVSKQVDCKAIEYAFAVVL